jgi:hypothetical protein
LLRLSASHEGQTRCYFGPNVALRALRSKAVPASARGRVRASARI